jgi:hypothetical protein
VTALLVKLAGLVLVLGLAGAVAVGPVAVEPVLDASGLAELVEDLEPDDATAMRATGPRAGDPSVPLAPPALTPPHPAHAAPPPLPPPRA